MTESAMTAADVGKLLNVNVETVYALIRSDGLPAARVGGRWRFSRPKVLAWFESRHVHAQEASPGTRGVAGEAQ